MSVRPYYLRYGPKAQGGGRMSKGRIVWTLTVAVAGLLAWFGYSLKPDDWAAAKRMLGAAENWIEMHAAYPALATLCLGLLFGTVIIPEVWHALRDHMFPLKPRPDVDGATALKEIVRVSRRAKELAKQGLKLPKSGWPDYESHLTDSGIIEKRLKAQLVDELHDFLRLGDVTAWGTPDGRKPHQPIAPEEWSEIALDFVKREMEADPPHVHAVVRKGLRNGKAYGYVWVKLNRRQVYRAFPRAWWPRRMNNGPQEKPFANAPI